MIRKTLLAVAAIGSMVLSGCNIYFGPDNDGCGFGDCSVAEPQPDPGDVAQPGGECISTDQCAAGCYCDVSPETGEGVCVETGFCDSAIDCTDGFICDARGTCVPDQALPPSCAADDECTQGSVCEVSDDGVGQCVETGVCQEDTDCLTGLDCDKDRGTCVSQDPTPECDDFTTEVECLAAGSCSATYRGLDCTSPDGSSCTSGQTNCTCQQFIFDECI
jgi:hypothetical protein